MTDPAEPTPAEPVTEPIHRETVGRQDLPKLIIVGEHGPELIVPASQKTRINLMQRHRRIE